MKNNPLALFVVCCAVPLVLAYGALKLDWLPSAITNNGDKTNAFSAIKNIGDNNNAIINNDDSVIISIISNGGGCQRLHRHYQRQK